MSVRVSVVVPTYRRTVLLRRCLNALVAQRLARPSYEILVVDDGRSNVTQSSVQSFARRLLNGPAVRYLQPPFGAHGPAAARNVGWRAATGEIIAFTDDDTLPAQNWLAEGVRAMAEDIAAVAGMVTVPLPLKPTDWDRNTARLQGAEFVTANCFVRRAVLEATGGFDERFTRAWREDSDLYFTLLEHRCKVAAAPSALVVHPVRPAPRGASLKQQRNMFFDALLYKKHRTLYREKIAATPPIRYYVIVLSLAIAIAALATGHFGAAVAASVAWLVLTVQFALRRLRGTSKSRHHVVEMLLTSAAIPVVAVYWRLAGALHFRVPFA